MSDAPKSVIDLTEDNEQEEPVLAALTRPGGNLPPGSSQPRIMQIGGQRVAVVSVPKGTIAQMQRSRNSTTAIQPLRQGVPKKKFKSKIDSSLISDAELDRVKERIDTEKSQAERLKGAISLDRGGKARLGLMQRNAERSVTINENVLKTIIAHKEQNKKAVESGGCVDLPGLDELVNKMRSGQEHFTHSFSKLGANFQKKALARLFEKSRQSNTEAHTNLVKKLCQARNVKRVKGDKDWTVISGEYNSVRYYAYKSRHCDLGTHRALRYSVVMSVHRDAETEKDTSLGLPASKKTSTTSKTKKKTRKKKKGKKGKKKVSKKVEEEKASETEKNATDVSTKISLDERMIFAVIQRDGYGSGMVVYTIMETLQNIQLAHTLLKNLQLAEINARFTLLQCKHNDLMNEVMSLEDEIYVLGTSELGDNTASPNGDSMTSFTLNGAIDIDHEKHVDLLKSVFMLSSESQDLLKRIGKALMLAKKEQQRQNDIVDAKRREIGLGDDDDNDEVADGAGEDEDEFIEID